MKWKFRDEADAERRMNNTVIRHAGVPFLIEVGSRKQAAGRFLNNWHVSETIMYNAETDFSSVPAGYTNLNSSGTVYVIRPPTRTQHQGFSLQFCKCYGFQDIYEGLLAYPKDIVCNTHPFHDTVVSKYPVFIEAIERIKTENHGFGWAFDRYFALYSLTPDVFVIRHLIDNIGLYFLKQNKSLLSSHFENNARVISQLKTLGVPM